MKGNRIITTLVVLTMLLSTLVVFNQLTIINRASAQPGVDEWGQASSEIVYDVTYLSGEIKINTSQWVANGTYYLYYPNYWSVFPGIAANFTWDGPIEVSDYSVRVTATKVGYVGKPGLDSLNTGGGSIQFLRAGMWVFADHIPTSAFDWVGYLWVNTSTVYSINAPSSIGYGSTADVTITVTEGGSNVPCMIAVLDPLNNTIYNSFDANTTILDHDFFNYAGDYTIRAYRDLDQYAVNYYYIDENGDAYSPKYGMNIKPVSGYYDYNIVGPWDPPEKNATENILTVTTGKPNIVLTNTTTYWGHATRIDVNVTDFEGNGIDTTGDSIKLKKTGTTTFFTKEDFTRLIITNEGEGNYSILLPEYSSDTEDDWAILTNGTWCAYFVNDINDDGIEEWNTSATFFIKYGQIPAFIFGRITNLITTESTITFKAVKTRVVIYSPFSFNTYISEEKFIISEDYSGFISVRYIFARCELLLGTEKTI